jgi:hypothetical protein
MHFLTKTRFGRREDKDIKLKEIDVKDVKYIGYPLKWLK